MLAHERGATSMDGAEAITRVNLTTAELGAAAGREKDGISTLGLFAAWLRVCRAQPEPDYPPTGLQHAHWCRAPYLAAGSVSLRAQVWVSAPPGPSTYPVENSRIPA